MSYLNNGLTILDANQRRVLDKLMGMQGINKDKIQPHILRIEVPLVNGESSFEFQLTDQKNNNPSRTQNKLNLTDAFAPVAHAVGVMKAKIVNGKTYSGNSKVYFNPNATIFDGAAVGGFTEAECVGAIWHGSDLSADADGKELLYRLDMDFFKYVPEVQGDGAAVQESTGGLPHMEAFQPYGRDIVMFGGNEHKATVDMREANTATIAGDPAAAATEANVAVYFVAGYLIRGGADVKTYATDLQNCGCVPMK